MEEPRYSYQGITVLRASIARTPGLEPDSGTVTMLAKHFAGLRFERPSNLYAGPAGAARTGERTESAALEGSLQIRGDLVAFDGVRERRWENLYVRDDGMHVTQHVDDETGESVVEFSVVDVRYFWPTRGEVFGTYNVLRPDGSFDPDTIQSGGGQGAQGTTSLRGAPWTLRELVEKLLHALPGSPAIAKAPERLRTITPANLTWNPAKPKDELERLLKTYKLTANLTLENELELTDESEPLPADARTGAPRELGGASLPEGRWKRLRRRAYRHRPQAVRVVGKPVVREVAIDRLEPVGFGLYPSGEREGEVNERKLETWADAAGHYGLTLHQLAQFVLVPDAHKGAILEARGLGRDRVREIERWAFAMFAVPQVGRGLLPMLDERAETMLKAAARTAISKRPGEAPQEVPEDPDEPRRRTPPLVEAEIFEEVLEPNAAPATSTTAPRLTPLSRVTASGPAPAPAPPPQVAGVSLAAIKSLAGKRRQIRFVNRPLARLDGQVDGRRGIVKFSAPVGHLVSTDIRAKSQGTLRFPPRVRITFAYEDSAKAREALAALGLLGDLPQPGRGAAESMYLYTYLAARGKDGKVEHLNPNLVDPPNVATLYPQTVLDDTFRLFVTLDGRSNKAALDGRAKEIAEQLLLGPDDVAGEDGVAEALLDIHPSSVISRVRWEMGPGVAKTSWSIENVGAAKATLAARIAPTEVVDRRR